LAAQPDLLACRRDREEGLPKAIEETDPMKTIFAPIAMLVFLPAARADEFTDAYQRDHEYQRGYNDGFHG
jgi:hypothetical protein